jgi:hypothetical protein
MVHLKKFEKFNFFKKTKESPISTEEVVPELIPEVPAPKFYDINLNLPLEVENNYRRNKDNFNENEFLAELGVPEYETFSMTFWTSLEMGRDKYRGMSDDDFFNLYKKETTSMKHLKRFTEAIVDYKSDDIDALMDEINTYPNQHRFQLSELSEMGSKYDIEFVDYNTFLNDLSERDKSTAPPRTAQFFALVNRNNNKMRIVLNLPMPFIPKDFFNQVPIGDILKHEKIHTIQYSKRPFETPLPEPKDKTKYFSDKDEAMAFSFSIAKEIVSEYPNVTSPREAMDKLKSYTHRGGMPKFRLYDDVKKNVDEKTLNRYHKYIYLYLEDLLKPEE